MSSLLPTRLRTAANGMKGIHAAVAREAADEIERLRQVEADLVYILRVALAEPDGVVLAHRLTTSAIRARTETLI